jgi:hypothetical protein
MEKENPTGWRLWGLHRDGNIDRFLGANVLLWIVLSHKFVVPPCGKDAYAIYGSNIKQVGQGLLLIST